MFGSGRYPFLCPFDLHKHLMNNYVLTRKGTTTFLKRDTSKDKRDIDVIRENHKFLWDDSEEPDSWEKKLAKKYYNKLFKEYCICDLSRFKENMVAMRWQTEAELVTGKGQFICGEKHCNDLEGLRSWEVNFGYVEEGIKKNALVKLRLCPECSYKLNYKSKKKEAVKNYRKNSILEVNFVENNKEEKKSSEPVCNAGNSSSNTKKECVSQEDNIWKDSGAIAEEQSRDEDFEDYLEQLML